MGQLVGNNVNVLLVTTDNGGGSKGVNGVLHATVREARRQDKDVVLAPSVREDNLLSSVHELVHVAGKLPLASSELIGAANNGAVGTNLGRLDITGSNGEEVRGNGHLLLELVDLFDSGSRGVVTDGAATGNGRQLGGEREGECRLDVGSILAREDGAGVDGLALGEHVRVLFVGGLGGSKPLESSALVSCLKLDRQVNQIALGGTVGDGDVERGTEWVGVRLELPLGLDAVDGGIDDLDESGVEDDLLALLVGLALQLQSDGALEALVVKVESKVDAGVLGAPSAVVGERGGISGSGHLDGCETSFYGYRQGYSGRLGKGSSVKR